MSRVLHSLPICLLYETVKCMSPCDLFPTINVFDIFFLVYKIIQQADEPSCDNNSISLMFIIDIAYVTIIKMYF